MSVNDPILHQKINYTTKDYSLKNKVRIARKYS